MEKIKISYRHMIFLEGIIMAIALLSISWISISIFTILKKNIEPTYLQLAMAAALIIWMIYSIPKIYRMPNIAAISSRVYSRNLRRIYEVLETKKDGTAPNSIPYDLLVMPVNMFHDQMKQDGRNFTPDIARWITKALHKIEQLPHY